MNRMRKNTLIYISTFLICISLTAQEGKIYFTSGKAENRRQKNIGVIKPDGTAYNEVTFTASSRSEYQPHVSDNGEKMTFNTYRYGGWKIAIANSDGSKVKKLTKSNNYEYDASWSPDGKIVLVGFPSGNFGKRQIYLVDPKTGSKELLTDGKDAHYSPSFLNANEIVFSINMDGYYGIYTMDIESKKKVKLVDSPDYHEVAPKISPDGKSLAYHRVNDNREIELVIYDIEPKTQQVIYSGWEGKEKLSSMETPLFPFTIGWSPNSNQLVFTSMFDSENYELIRIDKDGSNRKRLTFNPWSDIQPHWTNN